MKNILVLEFITTVGGVQTVYKNILPNLAREFKIFFLDPYENSFDIEIVKNSKIELIKLKIQSTNKLGWSKRKLRNFLILFRYGFSYFVFLIRLIDVLRIYNIDLIYVSGKKELLIAYLVKKMVGINYIYHSHGFSSHNDIGHLFRICINDSKKIIAVSEDVKKKLIKANINLSKIEVIHNGINKEFLSCDDIEKKSVCDKIGLKLLYIGTIQEQKGILDLLKAVVLLVENKLDITLDIVGAPANDDDKNYLNNLIEISRTIEYSRVRFHGHKNNVKDYISNCDILILPSRNESFGMVLLEAMSRGIPVIGSRVGGIPEVILEHKCGLLFESGDYEDLADKIKYLYYNPLVRLEYGCESKKIIESKFLADDKAREIISLINSIFLSKV